jgi:hypothetical protein
VGRSDDNMGVRTMLGQNHFLHSFRAARLVRLANGTSDEALGVHSVRTDWERCSRVLVLEFLSASRPDGP